jgi:hypothetical protein
MEIKRLEAQDDNAFLLPHEPRDAAVFFGVQLVSI